MANESVMVGSFSGPNVIEAMRRSLSTTHGGPIDEQNSSFCSQGTTLYLLDGQSGKTDAAEISAEIRKMHDRTFTHALPGGRSGSEYRHS